MNDRVEIVCALYGVPCTMYRSFAIAIISYLINRFDFNELKSMEHETQQRIEFYYLPSNTSLIID